MRGAAAFAIMGGVAVVLAPQVMRHLLLGGESPTLEDVGLVTAWVALEAGVFTVTLRWTDRRQLPMPWNLALAYAAAALAGVLAVVSVTLIIMRLPGHETLDPNAPAEAAVSAFDSLVVLGIWMLVFVTPRLVAAARHGERERQELLREAEHARARATLEPHFVLNTLNAIGSLVGHDPETARELIGDLGDLLRDVMRNVSRTSHTLDEEVRWLKRYARILEVRHRDRLRVSWDLDPRAMSRPIPVLLLQPLLENAIHHGALAPGGGGHVEVRIAVMDAAVECSIRDDGPGISEPRPDGRGLEIVRRRVACEVPGGALTVESGSPGTTATVTLRGGR